MKFRVLKFLLLFVLCLPYPAAFGLELSDVQDFLAEKIPSRPYFAMTGSQFAKYVSGMDESMREQAIQAQLAIGNIPDFLKKLKPVYLDHIFEDGKAITATIFVMPDYLAIGSDRDFLRMPMNLYTAVKISERFGFVLPTKKIVDAIFKQSAFHFTPKPMQPGPQMRSTAYYWKHNQKIKEERQASRCPLDVLVSGHKKDVVLTNRLARTQGRIAIYGWHRPSGDPIQPLTTVHRADYADYSHGIRLVGSTILLDGEPRSIYEVLEDSRNAEILSDEGPIREARQLMTLGHQPPLPPVEASRFSTRSIMQQSSNSKSWPHP